MTQEDAPNPRGRGEQGCTSGDVDGDVGQCGDSIRGPCEEASNDLHRRHPTPRERTERQLGSQRTVSCLPPPMKAKNP